MKPASIRMEKLRNSHTVDGTRMQHAVELSVVDFIPEDSIDFVFVTAEHNALDITDFLPLRYGLATGIEWLARNRSRDADDVSRICDSFGGMVNNDVSTLAVQPGCLRFVMQEADVFTFQFR
jgi:hypothetical protein